MFRTLLILLCLGALPSILPAQNPVVRDFIRQHRKGGENIAVRVPGWLISLASDIGDLATDEPEEELIFALAQEFGTTRLLTFNTRDFATDRDVTKLLHDLESDYAYERWASFRGPEGERVQLTVRMDDEVISEIVAIVSDPSEERTFFAHSRTDLTAEELGHILNRLMAEEDTTGID
ncbi:DUF4252 domain-containing protein [Neolewinella lacunae]|uniref:DUF4252 domain-containing protein n=1 Tax=Neolewinella lacunae TaxID=1517758 RepID=A0A923PLG9_9BACT|nr:DUF4252 domain-containing protein [Neolewinella lacunae]MBC6995594.1 DUF4252 domain-containing protein [Neolewinella lacunae]MDN3635630.1 DUF4252 domain-containing protein [Neolewinella lacunae]